MKTSYLVLGLCFLLMFANCKRENDSSDVKALSGISKLKRVSLVSSIDSKEPLYIQDQYEYNSSGQIIKVSSPMYIDNVINGLSHYEIYQYDANGQLMIIKTYNSNLNSSSGFYNSENHIFSYINDGKKEKETIEYPQMSYSIYSIFKYDGDKLTRIEKYGTSNTLESYIVNEYDGFGKLMKESFFGNDNKLYSYTINTYSNGLNIKSDVFSGINMERAREIIKRYNDKNNLSTLQSTELLIYSSASSYIMMYEYN